MAGADHLQLRAAVLLRAQLAVEEGQEAAAGALVEDRGVEALQDRRAAEALACEEAQGVPGEAGDRGRVRAGAADVADGEAVGAVTDREEVVEVTADLVALAGRAVDDLDLHAVDDGEFGWQEAALEGLADGGALGVQPGVVEGQGGPAGEVLGQLQDLLAEVLVRGLAEGEHADDAVAGHQRQDDRLAADRGRRGEGRADAGADAGEGAQAEAAHGGAQGGLVGGLRGSGPDTGAGGGDGVGRGDLGEQRLDAVDEFLVLVQDVGEVGLGGLVGDGVDGAPGGQGGNRHLGHQGEGLVAVQGAGEQVGGLDQEAQ